MNIVQKRKRMQQFVRKYYKNISVRHALPIIDLNVKSKERLIKHRLKI
jgi:hypothetical protein